ncbi:MAG: MFS transporter [Pirellulaceae bacterium]|nr:MFS transporter [Pirellulaceae bacterium]
MEASQKATVLWRNFFKISMPQMRAFHMSWFAFFLCFFAWFGIAPLMAVVRDEFGLTKDQIGWSIIASVAITILARLFIGWFCDRFGPRIAYTWLLIVGSIPVMCIGLAYDANSFIFFRLLIGFIGASFVITQYHTSVMFAPNVVGTANATSAGWGNLGGGVTQLVMPILYAFLLTTMGFSTSASWRLSMVVAGAVCLLTGVAYYFLTQDTPEGNFSTLKREGKINRGGKGKGVFAMAFCDYRAWALFVVYAACFGIELTVNNVAALYFVDNFEYFRSLSTLEAMKTAGLIAGLFGLTNVFARTLGGASGDFFGVRWGLKGRVLLLFMVLFCEGIALMVFSQMHTLIQAIPALLIFSLFVQMSEGATFSVVPFVNKRAIGGVSGIVGAGGNAGAVLAGFLFKGSITWPTCMLILGGLVTLSSFCAFAVSFSGDAERDARRELAAAIARKRQGVGDDAKSSDAAEPETAPELQPI